MKFNASTTSVLLTFSSLLASAIPIAKRDVYVPPVLAPAEGDVWVVGQNQTVTWQVKQPPPHITNPIGRIMLRKGEQTLNVTLADNFDILSGTISVTVPNVGPGDDYRVVLFGDSGNWSPPFTIATADG
ncbi:hypothetical protein LshimejAT787_0404900 [Lyophyllum shimeji]|uniref:Yeast cell wall synthesis Kre9/Knh1-like N-terminal domain-containing protein n=1 Tax=Lyophyllum shimeji TaxID=47721 RepID=A0A9P3PL59_LYOSH|nr:hypothetical protein LshimejAT787_0404900 [Lyophyllum shimeji]